MAKTSAAISVCGTWFRGAAMGWWMACCMATQAQAPATADPPSSAGPAAAASSPTARPGQVTLRWRPVPRVIGRITGETLGVVINTADPYSVEVGEYYIQRRRIPPAHVLRVELPLQTRLSEAEFESFKARVDAYFGAEVQGLALAWMRPYAATCQSITGALALGLDPDLCRQTCDKSRLSAYFNSSSGAPFRDHGLRPSMLLASRSVAEAKALIDRGMAADHTLGLKGALPVHAYYMATADAARSVRVPLFPPPGLVSSKGVDVHVQQGVIPLDADRVLLVETGVPRLPSLEGIRWVPGALADHLTSVGGMLDQREGQTPALAWLAAGATASYGTVSEPCNHLQKFPHPQVLLLHYLQGSTALEAYWKSVAWPQQGVFVGEPLAAPFAPVEPPQRGVAAP